jgi:WD40 repeat protein
LPNHRYVAQAVFAPGSRILALLDGAGVRLYEVATGKQLAAYPATDVRRLVRWESNHSIQTQTVAFSPDGRTLATGHLDGTVLLWKVPQPAAK